MKVQINNQAPQRKLVAVIGADGVGIFLPQYPDGDKSRYLDGRGMLSVSMGDPIESLAKSSERKPVYEGDTVTLTF